MKGKGNPSRFRFFDDGLDDGGDSFDNGSGADAVEDVAGRYHVPSLYDHFRRQALKKIRRHQFWYHRSRVVHVLQAVFKSRLADYGSDD